MLHVMSKPSSCQFHVSLRIIDALAPFSLTSKRAVINWSKIDFEELEVDGKLPQKTQNQIIQRFILYVERAVTLGYNALSIDDLAHLVNRPYYEPKLQALLAQYTSLYRKLFAIANTHNLQLFINTDYMFTNEAIDQRRDKTGLSLEAFFADCIERLLSTFPEVDGIILRIGEHDGNDVDGHFISRLAIRTPEQANKLLRTILPIFEKHNKTLIFRTWTVGAYSIGDLIWNQRTFNAVFSSIDSDHLIISMKFGDTDFMRHLALNPLFFTSSHKKLIELQTRREWEGMGIFPSFIGYDYAHYLQKLADNSNVVGVHVWCQTGGWAVNIRSGGTLLDEGDFWNELNTFVTARLSTGASIEQAISAFCKSQHITDVQAFAMLLQLADQVICKGLYMKGFAEQTLYFRRIRIPPLLWLMWDSVVLNSAVRSIFQTVVHDKAHTIREGYDAIKAVRQMIVIAKKLDLPPIAQESLAFEEATMALFAELRKYLLKGLNQEEIQALQKQYAAYCERFPQHYIVSMEALVEAVTPPSRAIQTAIKLLIRKRSAYRAIDKLLLFASPVQRQLARYFFKKAGAKIVNQSMGLESILK